jgi:hypothetical protein
MTLKKIQIENVKGISNRTFELDILPNKPSLLVAPNGFGKSSFACAFLSLKNNRISLHDNHLHRNEQELESKLSIEYEDQEGIVHSLVADSTSNTISDHFSYFVINNQIKAKGIGRNIGGRTNVTADLAIEPVTLIDTIPQREDFSYLYSNSKNNFGRNGKVLPNISDYFSDLKFITTLSNYYIDLEKISQVRNKDRISEIITDINSQTGTADNLNLWINENKIQNLIVIEPLNNLAQHIMQSNLGVQNIASAFLIAIQIHYEYEKDKFKFKKAIKYSDYKLEKNEYQEMLSAFNTTWRNITPKESQSKLIVEFPKANQISNGQRDVITFITLLFKAERKLKSRNSILIIDEVFDYLDDANLVAVQYYITKFIKKFKNEGRRLYPLILTHLNPFYFKNFAFNNQKVYFLDKKDIRSNQAMIKLIKNREEVNIKDDVSKFLLHYNPVEINRRNDFQALGLRETWGESNNFYLFINNEARKYLEGEEEFDPLAVCCAIRIAIEKYAYQLLVSDVSREEFIKKFKTRDKLAYAEETGASIPEYFYLLGVIYNDGMHWKDGQDNISPIAAKLENHTIRYLIEKIMAL